MYLNLKKGDIGNTLHMYFYDSKKFTLPNPYTVTYLENTNSNSPNPVVSFENDGLYQVSLTTENANSISSVEKNDFYNVISEDLLSKEIEISEDFSVLNFPPENWEVLNEFSYVNSTTDSLGMAHNFSNNFLNENHVERREVLE